MAKIFSMRTFQERHGGPRRLFVLRCGALHVHIMRAARRSVKLSVDVF
jgi:hypothetical protein